MNSSGLHYRQCIWCIVICEMHWFFSCLEPGSGTYLCQETMYRSEYCKRSRRTAPYGPPGMATQVRPACRRHYLYSSIACRSTWQLSSAPSPPVQFEFHEGCQIEATYSSCWRTNILYATSLVCLGAKAKLCRRKPIVVVALQEISETC